MKKYSLAALQLGYLQLTMKEEKDGNQCVYCWSTGCECENKTTVKNDPFINLTAEELRYV